jgi:hypothetical protein
MLSRAVAGVRHGKLIVNLPGNPKAVRENLRAIGAALPHAISTPRGDVGEHSRPEGCDGCARTKERRSRRNGARFPYHFRQGPPRWARVGYRSRSCTAV